MILRIPLLLALVACGNGKDNTADSGPATGSGTGTTALTAVAAPAPQTGAVWLVSWTTDAPGTGWVEFGPTPALGRSTEPSGPNSTHDHALIGLKAGLPVYWQAHAEVDGVQLASEVESFDAAPAPVGLGVPIQTVSKPGSAMASGFLQMSQIQASGQSWMYVLDGDGDLVWYRKANQGSMIVTSRPARNGADLLYAEWDLAQRDEVGWLFRVGLDGRASQKTLLDKGHHDFYEWPDGTIGFYGFEVDTTAWVASDAVMEVAEGAITGTPTTRIWSWLDDYPATPWQACSHTAAPWPQDARFTEGTHSNSLMVDPSGEHYFAMSKFQDALLKIRRADGALIWQLNGEHGDFTTPGGGPIWTGLGQSTLWTHGHASHLYAAPAGSGYDLCLAVFDNGMHKVPEQSRAIEVCLDETAMTAEVTWAYDEPNGGFTALMGDVRKLDDSWLVAWSDIGHTDEISPSGEVLWSVELPSEPPPPPGAPSTSTGRVSYLPSL